jgi:hypothetical protein
MNCSGSYAIATVSAIGDRFCKATGEKYEFSPQEIISCNVINENCNGGFAKESLDHGNTKGMIINYSFFNI